MRRPRKDIIVAGCFLLVSLLLAGAMWWAWREYITSPPFVDPDRFPVRGIDVSAHNGMMNLNAARADGIEFIFIKASEGAGFRDENFVLNYQKASHAGMKVGAYHFFRFDVDGVAQAVNLLRSVGPRPLDLGLVIDVEEDGNPGGYTPDQVAEQLQKMVEYLNMRGHRVMFYSNERGYNKYLFRDEFRGFPFWICSFTEDTASAGSWSFWQYSHRGRVAGIRGDVDLNAFHGSWTDWEKALRNNAPLDAEADNKRILQSVK